MKIKSTDPHVDLRHLQRIAEDIDALSATVVETAIEEVKKLREEIKKYTLLAYTKSGFITDTSLSGYPVSVKYDAINRYCVPVYIRKNNNEDLPQL